MIFLEIPDLVGRPAKARIIDFPDAAKPNCRLLEGWMERSIEIITGIKIITTEVKCKVDGDEYCEFLCVGEERK